MARSKTRAITTRVDGQRILSDQTHKLVHFPNGMRENTPPAVHGGSRISRTRARRAATASDGSSYARFRLMSAGPLSVAVGYYYTVLDEPGLHPVACGPNQLVSCRPCQTATSLRGLGPLALLWRRLWRASSLSNKGRSI
jgi:hypothetical protein